MFRCLASVVRKWKKKILVSRVKKCKQNYSVFPSKVNSDKIGNKFFVPRWRLERLFFRPSVFVKRAVLKTNKSYHVKSSFQERCRIKTLEIKMANLRSVLKCWVEFNLPSLQVID